MRVIVPLAIATVLMVAFQNCSDSVPNGEGALTSLSSPAYLQNHQKTIFSYTGNSQIFIVPAGVNRVRVKAWGAGGAGLSPSAGGGGAFVIDELTVTPGETLTVNVGQGGVHVSGAWGGGGASAIIRASGPALVAGAGGAGPENGGSLGGAGGCNTGADGTGPAPGRGGSQISGGASGGGMATAGALLTGGDGHIGNSAASGRAFGGGGQGYWKSGDLQSSGGGGGYFGGGGSGPRTNNTDSASGGGSSLWSAMGACSAGIGINSGGSSDPDITSPMIGRGDNTKSNGGNGLVIIY